MENKNNIEQFDAFFKGNMQGLEPELPGDLWSGIDQAYQAGQQATVTAAAASKTILSVIIKAAAVLIPATLITWYVLTSESQVNPLGKAAKVEQGKGQPAENESKAENQINNHADQTGISETQHEGVKEETSAQKHGTVSVREITAKSSTQDSDAGIKTPENETPAIQNLPPSKPKQLLTPGNNINPVKSNLTVSFEADKPEICFGDIVQLSNNTTGNFSAYHWDFDDGHTLDQVSKETITYRYDRPGVYNITLVGQTREGEKINAVRKVKVGITQAYYIIDKSAYPLVKFSNQSKSANTFIWDFGDNSALSTQKNPIHQYSANDKVNARLIAQDGVCSDTFQMEISPYIQGEKENIFIPNVITPNWDGINDVWQVKASNITSYHLTIMDRAGKIIMESSDYNEGWKGICSDGRLCAPGDYFYLLTIGVDGKPASPKTGVIKLIQ